MSTNKTADKALKKECGRYSITPDVTRSSHSPISNPSRNTLVHKNHCKSIDTNQTRNRTLYQSMPLHLTHCICRKLYLLLQSGSDCSFRFSFLFWQFLSKIQDMTGIRENSEGVWIVDFISIKLPILSRKGTEDVINIVFLLSSVISEIITFRDVSRFPLILFFSAWETFIPLLFLTHFSHCYRLLLWSRIFCLETSL